MKVLKIILIVLAVLIVILVGSFGIYLVTHRQGVIASSELKNPQATHTVLIAGQGSKFKNALIESLIVALKDDPVSIKVIDVTTLGEVNEADWHALVLIHTTEMWQLQANVKSFLDRSKDRNKIVLVTTSGSGNWKTEDYPIDALTAASRSNELTSLGNAILNRLDVILAEPAQ